MKNRYCLFGSFAALVVLIAGCGESNSRPSGRPGGAGGKVVVSALALRPQPLDNKIFSTGTLIANEEVELRSEIAGRVTGIFFEEGAAVNQGQLLLKINDSELRAQLKRKEAELVLAMDEERRTRSLFDISAISQQDYDKAANALKIVQAEKEVTESQLAKTEIMAPFDGIVGLRHVSEGSYVTTSMLIAQVQDVDPMKVEFSVPEKYVGLLKPGTEVAVRSGGLQEEYRGTVYAVEAKIDIGTRTIKARARIPNPTRRLVPGAFARVELMLERIADAIVVPAGAVVPELNGEKVFLISGGKARAVAVTTGIRTESSVQVIEGLGAADTLATTGLLQLSDGASVEIVNLQSQ